MLGRAVAGLAVAVAVVVMAAPPVASNPVLPYFMDFESGTSTFTSAVRAWSGTCGSTDIGTSGANPHAGATAGRFYETTVSADCGLEWSSGSGGGFTPVLTVGAQYTVASWVFYPPGSTSTGSRTMCVAGWTVAVTCSSALSSLTLGQWNLVTLTFNASNSSTGTVRWYGSGSTSYTYVDDLSLVSGAAAASCGSAGQSSCNSVVTGGTGFFDGIGSAVGSVLSSPLSAITSAVNALGSTIVNGFSSLLLPSSTTTSGIAHLWDVAQTRFPFSVMTDLATLPSTFFDHLHAGVVGGAPSFCPTADPAGACAATVSHLGSGMAGIAVVATARSVVLFVLTAFFAYGCFRAIGREIK